MPSPFSFLSAALRRRPRLDMRPYGPAPAEGFLVGGAVRDALLGIASKDLDWLVQDPERSAREMAERLGGNVFPLDEERGHWRLVAGERTLDFIPLTGGLEEDLRERDFTVNAMAADASGRIVDVTGGLSDLSAKRLRMTSAAALSSDPLRLWRGARFAASLGFEIEPKTHEELQKTASLVADGKLGMPSWERVRDELDQMLLGSSPGFAVSHLEGLGLLSLSLPELEAERGVDQGDFHHLDVLDHSLEALQRVASIFPESPLALRWATLLHDVGKPAKRERGEDGRIHFHGHDRLGAQLASRVMRRLRHSERTSQRVAALVRYHMVQLPRSEREARRFVHRRRELLPDLLKLMIADREAARGRLSSEATRRAYRTALSRIVGLLEEEPPAAPLLDGREVMELLGLSPGPRVGEALRFLAEATAVGDVGEREEAVAALQKFAVTKGWLE